MAQNRRTPEPVSLVFSCDNSSWSSGNPGRSAARSYFICHHPTAGASPGCWWQMGTTVTAPSSPAIVATIPTVHRACRSSRQGKAHSPVVPSPCRATLPDSDGCGGHRYVLLLYGHRLFLNICLRWQGISMAFPFLWCIRKVTESREWWCIPAIPAVGKAEASGSQFEASL